MSTKFKTFEYSLLDTNIKMFEMVEQSIIEDISTYAFMLEDNEELETIEDYKSLMLDLLVANKRNLGVLFKSIESLKENANFMLNDKNSKKINVHFDDEFKKQLVSDRR